MNIKEAKDEIKRTAIVYLQKDSHGHYLYPVTGQRPLLLMGPPGIGKSAIVEQAARETGIGFVSYSLTHHTRQSALGLPHITTHSFHGENFYITEYTMSEIIASIYQRIETKHQKEGILFIDEINCVSETLTPIMLQFLQTKTFGTHEVPEGWMIVAAGNPTAYNRSAKDLDIVTLDRVRTLQIEPDLPAWLSYAEEHHVHPSILSYLQLHPDHFYKADADISEKLFATPRGWEDLSMLLLSYEKMGWKADRMQIFEFIGDKKIAESFAAYYALYCRHGEDYPIQEMLQGTLDPTTYSRMVHRGKNADLEERLILIGLLLSGLKTTLHQESAARTEYQAMVSCEEAFRNCMKTGASLTSLVEDLEKKLKLKQETLHESGNDVELLQAAIEGIKALALDEQGHTDIWNMIWETNLEKLRNGLGSSASQAASQIDHAFTFCEDSSFREEDLFLLVTSLSKMKEAMIHISEYGNDTFFRWSKRLGL